MAASSYQLSDIWFGRLRRPPAGYRIDDPCPKYAAFGDPSDYVGLQGPVLDCVLFREIEPARGRVADPDEMRAKRVVTTTCLSDSRLSRPHSLNPCLPAAVSLLPAVYVSIV